MGRRRPAGGGGGRRALGPSEAAGLGTGWGLRPGRLQRSSKRTASAWDTDLGLPQARGRAQGRPSPRAAAPRDAAPHAPLPLREPGSAGAAEPPQGAGLCRGVLPSASSLDPSAGQPGGSPGAWGLGGRAGGGGPEWWLVSSLSRGWPEPAGAKVAPRRPGTDGAPVQGWTARGACPLAAVGTDSGTSLPSPPAPPCLPEASPKQSSMGRGEGPPSQPVGTRARRPSGPGVPKRRLLLAAGVRQLQAPVGSRARPPTLPRSRCAGRMVSRAHAAS